MSKRPWMKFYPSDWRGDPKLRLCSMGARGIWIELICLMHEGEPYGHMAMNGQTPTLDQVARLCGCSVKEATKWVGELITNDVLAAGPDFWFSRRMVRDKAKADEAEQIGKRGGNPKLKIIDNGGVNPPDKPDTNPPVNPRSQRPETRDQKDLDKIISDSVPRAARASPTATPEGRKQRWEQVIMTEVIRLHGPEEGWRIIEAYQAGDPISKRVFNAVSDSLGKSKPGRKSA
jgi:hypothetical protein